MAAVLYMSFECFISLNFLLNCSSGRLGIVDHDVVELNNMHRQVKIGNSCLLFL